MVETAGHSASADRSDSGRRGSAAAARDPEGEVLVTRSAIPALLLLLSCSCASTQTDITNVMASWDGSNANDLIASWGPPNRVMDDGEGGKIFIYILDRRSNTPAEVVTREFDNWFDGKGVRTTYTPSQESGYLAFRIFWVNGENVIYRWAWRGE